MSNFKKIFSAVLASAIALATMCISTSALSGDVNADGVFDISDATTIQFHLAFITQLTDTQLETAELNGDGVVDINDVTYIQQLLAGYDPDAPATDPTPEPELTMQEQIFNLVNQERAAAGLSPLKYDNKLAGYAQIRAKEIVTSFSHTRPDGTSCFTVIPSSDGYTSVGENIAYGYQGAENVMNAWMNSEGHRANILNDSFTNIGIGYVTVDGTPYYVQLFGGI